MMIKSVRTTAVFINPFPVEYFLVAMKRYACGDTRRGKTFMAQR